jgi:hypothetical protein
MAATNAPIQPKKNPVAKTAKSSTGKPRAKSKQKMLDEKTATKRFIDWMLEQGGKHPFEGYVG